MADELTTFAQCQAIFKPASADQDMIETLITAASVWANNYTSRKLKAQTLTEYYDGDGSATLFLNEYPINSVTSIHQDADREFASDTLIDSGDYVYYADRRKVIGTDTLWYSGIQTIKVIYNAGYAVIPIDLENAMHILIDYWYKSYDAHRFGVTSVGVADSRIAYEADIPQQVKNILAPYVKQVIF